MVEIQGGRPAAPDKLGMPDFQALYSKWGELSKSSRFLVMINPQSAAVRNYRGGTSYPTSELTYLCEAAEIPGRGFMSSDLRYYGPSFKVPYQSSYEDINLTFLIRDRFGERQFFDNWMEVINPSNNYDFSYRKDYLSEITIFQMSDLKVTSPQELPPGEKSAGTGMGQQRYAMTLQKAFPILVNPQPMTWADDNFHRLTVTFTYTRWHRAGLDMPRSEGSAEYKLIDDGSQVFTANGTKLPNILSPRT